MRVVYAVIRGNEIKPMTLDEAVAGRYLWFDTREEAVAFVLTCSV